MGVLILGSEGESLFQEEGGTYSHHSQQQSEGERGNTKVKKMGRYEAKGQKKKLFEARRKNPS